MNERYEGRDEERSRIQGSRDRSRYHPGDYGFQQTRERSGEGEWGRGEYSRADQQERDYGRRGGEWERYRDFGGGEYFGRDYGGRELGGRDYGLTPYRRGGETYGYGGDFGRRDFGGGYGGGLSRGLGGGEYGRGYGAYGHDVSRGAYGHERGERERGFFKRLFGRGPKGYKRSDERIKEDISERLWLSDDIDSSEVTVEVTEAKVLLAGTVPERWMRHEIENIADECPGVKDVDNDIRVDRQQQAGAATQTGTETGSRGTAGTTARTRAS